MPLGLSYGVTLGEAERTATILAATAPAVPRFVWGVDNGDGSQKFVYAAVADLASPTDLATSNYATGTGSAQGGVYHPGSGAGGILAFSMVKGIETYDLDTGTLKDNYPAQDNAGFYGIDVRDAADANGYTIYAMQAAGDDRIYGWTDYATSTTNVLLQDYPNDSHEGMAIVEDGLGTTIDADLFFNYDTASIVQRISAWKSSTQADAGLLLLHGGQGNNQSHLIIGLNASETGGLGKGVVISIAQEAPTAEFALAYVDGTGSTINKTFAEITGTIRSLTHDYAGTIYCHDDLNRFYKLTLADSSGNPTLTFTELLSTTFPVTYGRTVICIPAGVTIN